METDSPAPDADEIGPPPRLARRAAWGLITIIVAFVAITIVVSLRHSGGDPGNLTEVLFEPLPATRLPRLTDVTAQWGLDGWANTSRSHLSGGAALGDLDGDGTLDLVLAGGDVGIFFNDGGRFISAEGVPQGFGNGALSTAISDLDGDGLGDILIGPADGNALIIWGDPWVLTQDLAAATITQLPGGNQSTGFATADFDDDGLLDIVRLGYGRSSGAADVLFRQVGLHEFDPVALPSGDGKSLATEIADVDGDGALDIWVTRDVGWKTGADSLYSRDAAGVWRDVAPQLGLAMEIDGMGVTVADLTGDGRLDGYLSDIGENEFLIGDGKVYVPKTDSGAARIRPPGSDARVVSSSWASGVTDANLDGILDLVVINGGFPFFAVENKISGTRIELDDPPAVFLGLGDGRYSDVWPLLGLDWQGPGRGLAIGDIDRDGDDDFIVTRLEGAPIVYRNDSDDPAVTVRPARGCAPQGAVVTVPTAAGTTVQLLGAHSFLGSHAVGVIVGDPVPGATIEVNWPTGTITTAVIPSMSRSSVTVSCRP